MFAYNYFAMHGMSHTLCYTNNASFRLHKAPPVQDLKPQNLIKVT